MDYFAKEIRSWKMFKDSELWMQIITYDSIPLRKKNLYV